MKGERKSYLFLTYKMSLFIEKGDHFDMRDIKKKNHKFYIQLLNFTNITIQIPDATEPAKGN